MACEHRSGPQWDWVVACCGRDTELAGADSIIRQTGAVHGGLCCLFLFCFVGVFLVFSHPRSHFTHLDTPILGPRCPPAVHIGVASARRPDLRGCGGPS